MLGYFPLLVGMSSTCTKRGFPFESVGKIGVVSPSGGISSVKFPMAGAEIGVCGVIKYVLGKTYDLSLNNIGRETLVKIYQWPYILFSLVN